MDTINVKNLYINSAAGFRDITGTSENFTITKPLSNFNKAPKKVKLLSARIPFTWDNITAYNNVFNLIENGVLTHSGITVPVGRYTGATLAPVLQSVLNGIGGKLYTYTVTYDTNTFKFTFSATGNFQFDFVVANNMALALGFTETLTTIGTSVTSTGVAIIQPDFEIFIASDIVTGIDNGVVPWFTGTSTDLNILAVVPINTCFGGIIEYTCSDLEPWQLASQSKFALESQNKDTISISFRLFFLSGIPVDLKGATWNANILLEF